ncbi:MAG: glycosyltransferase [Brachybacterium sp.]|nr:glycosyltransferase [Brachybacterium sp.]
MTRLRHRDRLRAGLRERRPHIVVATRVFTPEPVAASFRQQALARALERAGAQVTVLTTHAPGDRAAVEEVQDVRRWPVKRDHQGQVRGYVSYMSFDAPLALRLLALPRVDAILAEPPPTTGLVTAAIAAGRRIPFAFYAADVWSDATDSVEGVPGPVRAAVRWMETTVWRRAARVLTISPGVDARVRALGGPAVQTTMVGNGIDTAAFTPDGPDAGEVGPYLVYAGTVSEWQGAEVFVEAFERARRTVPQGRLLFFSEGSGRDALERTVRERGIEGVEFRDKIPPHQVAQFLRGAAAGLSSITPGQGYEFALPTKVYAATACGTPVIHAGTGAAHDRIRDHSLGWACDYDLETVATAMVAALSGDHAPTPAHLRSWTEDHASLDACADRAAQAVLASLRTD